MQNKLLKKRIFLLLIPLIFFLSAVSQTALAKKYAAYAPISNTRLEVTISKLNVRTGPGTQYKRVGTVSKGTELDALGTLGDWYLVQLPDNSVGLVLSSHVRLIDTVETAEVLAPTHSTALSDVDTMINAINISRLENKLTPLAKDATVMQAAYAKALDMTVHQYFSHNSPTYGSPFEMLRNFGVVFKAAAENIAGSSNILSAHESIMESSSHRANILNPRFKKIGIGVYESTIYGKIIVQMFVE